MSLYSYSYTIENSDDPWYFHPANVGIAGFPTEEDAIKLHSEAREKHGKEAVGPLVKIDFYDLLRPDREDKYITVIE